MTADSLPVRQIVFVTILLILAGTAYLVSFLSAHEKARAIDGPSVSVVLTEQGFVPQEITIKQGTTVTFTTTTGKPFWPASNLHPQHDIYPEFDPKEPISPDASWSFVFNRVGDWGSHDHIRSYFTGIIHVIP